MSKFDPLVYVESDGLVTPEIGIWGLQKYKLMGMYCDIFTSGMKKQWKNLVYIDLFAGTGHAKIKNDNKIVKTSSLIAASTPNHFTHHILCEKDPDNMVSLQTRWNRDHAGQHVAFMTGDSNQLIKSVIDLVPHEPNTLRFCFVDPFSLNLEFNTIRHLAGMGRIDFLILLAFQMDAKRNFHNYINDESTKIDLFVGTNDWRKPFQEGKIPQKHFIKLLADIYDRNMEQLEYVVDPQLKMMIRNPESNVPLYYLAYYSKHKVGNEFYKKIEKYHSVQTKLF